MNQNIIYIYHNKDFKPFSKIFVNVALKTSWCIRKTKRHELILEVVIPNTKYCFQLIMLLNSHLMIDISEIKLGKMLGLV